MTNFLEATATGDFLPYMNWGSDAVQWSRKGDDGKEVFQPTQAIFDIENLMVGWIAIQIGSVDKVLVSYKDTPPAQPAGTKKDQQGKDVALYSKGFSVNVLFGKEFGEVRLYEFSTSQKGSLQAVNGLLQQFEAEKAANVGKVPVVTFSTHTNVKMGKGSSNVPGLKITAWTDRPAELDEVLVSSESAPQAVQATASEF